MNDQILIRGYEPGDKALIFSSWLNSYRGDSSFAKNIRSDIFYKWHHQILEGIMARPTREVYVAHAPDAPEVIIGWLVMERPRGGTPVIHYVFVKSDFRKFGIGKMLFDAAQISALTEAYYTHRTFKAVFDGLLKRYPGLIYDPYRI